ncbi:hypothetical protein [Salinicola halophilus]|uniref:hypothetical protein n=1 Tax=Salinicola halophilus TaxID=184065 RepID=UPI000DA17DB8|nr:hypothetical protein [Salinicola halophilus]
MTIADLVDDIVLDVPEAPLMTIREAARWAQREFCDGTNAWRDDAKVVVTGRTGELAAKAGAEPVRVLAVRDGGATLRAGRDYRQGDALSVTFGRDPDAPIATVALRPARGHDMPPQLLAHWREALIAGAKYRLLRMPQPWREMELAEQQRRRFAALIADALKTTSLGAERGTARVRPPRFI